MRKRIFSPKSFLPLPQARCASPLSLCLLCHYLSTKVELIQTQQAHCLKIIKLRYNVILLSQRRSYSSWRRFQGHELEVRNFTARRNQHCSQVAIHHAGTDHVIHFALFYLFVIWFHLILGYIFCVTLTKPGGYPNSAPRAYTAEGAIYRIKCSAENTFESIVSFIVAVIIFDKVATDSAQELIASWAVLVMLARTIYPG